MRPRRSTHPRAGLLCTAAALVAVGSLNGCSNSAQTNGAIAGAGTSATGVASGNPVSSASIPSDLTLDVVLTSTGNAAKDALLTKTKALLYAYEQAVARANPTDSLYQSMVSGPALLGVESEIEGFVKAGRRPIGVIKFYAFAADVHTYTADFSAADVTFCEDTSRTSMLVTATGATAAPPSGSNSPSGWDVGYLINGAKTTVESVVVRPGGSTCTR